MNELSRKIISKLPYGDDFRFVDEITFVNDYRIVGNYTFRANAPYYASHYPHFAITDRKNLGRQMWKVQIHKYLRRMPRYGVL